MGKKKNTQHHLCGLREFKKRICFIASGAGFTLIELLIVITVLGVLAGIILIVINPAEQMAKAKDAAKKTTVSQLADALQSYQALNSGKYPAAGDAWIDNLVASGDLKRVPPTVTSSCTENNQNGYCYKTNPPENTEAVVYTLLESSGISVYTPYFLWSSADNASGIYDSVDGNVPGTSGFTFGPNPTFAKDMVGWWKMDGNADDSTANNNHGTVTGAVLVDDRKGQALKAYSFNGSTDYVSIPLVVGTHGAFAWVKGTGAIISPVRSSDAASYLTFGIYNSTTLRLSLHYGDGNVNLDATITPDTWHHVGYSYGAGGMKIYSDGVLVNSNADTRTPHAIAYDKTFIGDPSWNFAGGYLNGSLDDVRIYNRALLPTEIKALYEFYQ